MEVSLLLEGEAQNCAVELILLFQRWCVELCTGPAARYGVTDCSAWSEARGLLGWGAATPPRHGPSPHFWSSLVTAPTSSLSNSSKAELRGCQWHFQLWVVFFRAVAEAASRVGWREEGEGIRPQRTKQGFLRVLLCSHKMKASCSAPGPKEYATGWNLRREMGRKQMMQTLGDHKWKRIGFLCGELHSMWHSSKDTFLSSDPAQSSRNNNGPVQI